MQISDNDKTFMLRAIGLAQDGMESNSGGPFGCVIAKGGRIIGEGVNQVTSTNDPTAHAEIGPSGTRPELIRSNWTTAAFTHPVNPVDVPRSDLRVGRSEFYSL